MKRSSTLIVRISMATWLLTLACSLSFIDTRPPAGIRYKIVDKEITSLDSTQTGFGTINGVVKDYDTGEGIPGVSIMLEDTQMGAAAKFDGHFFIEHIPPGKYTLTIKTIGYKPIIEEDLVIRTDETITMDITMKHSYDFYNTDF